MSDAGDVRARSPWERLPTAENAISLRRAGIDLDSQKMQEIYRFCMGSYLREVDCQGENRRQMAIDEDFYDSIQWTPEEIALLAQRGQEPTVYNVIATTCNWIIGTQKRAMTDFKVLARRKDASKAAERKTQLLKYLSDVNRDAFEQGFAFEDAVKAGVGWIESGAQTDDEGEPVYTGRDNWRYVIFDSAQTKHDMSDGRYLFRTRWADLDVAQAMFPHRAALLASAAQDSLMGGIYANGDDPMDSAEERDGWWSVGGDEIHVVRRRVRLIEGWFRMPVKVLKMRGGEFSGDFFDPSSHGQQYDLKAGKAELVERVAMRMHVAIFCAGGLVYISKGPYRHNRFSLTPIWCYRRARDNMPYGVIRSLRGIQSDINKRMSKSLAILATNKTIMDEDAVPDLNIFANEVSRPDSIIVKRPGKQLDINVDRELAAPHMEIMSRNIAMVQSVSGVTDESLGRTTNAQSGYAIERRQNQGALSTAKIFENLRLAKQIHGENMLSLVEQFFTEEKSFRITNMRGSPEYVTINDSLPENDIVRTKADYIISEDEWRASLREAQTAQLGQFMTQLAATAPQIVLTTLDLLVETMDIPNRDEIVRRIRQVTGMRDPDAEEPTQEDVARMNQQAKQAAFQEAMAAAELADKQAGAAQKLATAGRAKADAEKILSSIAGQNATTQKTALETALAMLSAPAAVPVADGVLHEAGFKSRTEQEDDANYAAAATQAAMERRALAEAAAARQQQPSMAQQPPPEGASMEQQPGIGEDDAQAEGNGQI